SCFQSAGTADSRPSRFTLIPFLSSAFDGFAFQARMANAGSTHHQFLFIAETPCQNQEISCRTGRDGLPVGRPAVFLSPSPLGGRGERRSCRSLCRFIPGRPKNLAFLPRRAYRPGGGPPECPGPASRGPRGFAPAESGPG